MNTELSVEVSQDIAGLMHRLGTQAQAAAAQLRGATTAEKNQVLFDIAGRLQAQTRMVLTANAKDIAAAEQQGLDAALIDRLRLTEGGIAGMIQALHTIAQLDDPVGMIEHQRRLPSGIEVGQMRVPIGVLGMIYESRPNVTIDAAALCIKSSNAVILRGGKEALHSNQALALIVSEALQASPLSDHVVQLVPTPHRDAVTAMLAAKGLIDVIIPRGGKGLVEAVDTQAKVPVIRHLDGNCHVYVDRAADTVKASAIVMNAKTRRYGVCNAMETLLVHADLAPAWLPKMALDLRAAGVELRGCPQTLALCPQALPATEQDWYEEYLAPILAIKVVANADAAMQHIQHYGSGHTDAIVTEDYSLARRFLTQVDSSSVIVNASTGFADGGEFGLGAEIGISTNKLHARGPVGLLGLTTQKYIVFGDGHTRS